MIDILKTQILHLLQKDGTPRRVTLLEQELGISPERRELFDEAIDRLWEAGQVIIDRRDLVRLPTLSQEVTGIFKADARGFGRVTPQQQVDHQEVFIPAKGTATAMTGDRVLVSIKAKKRDSNPDRLIGKIVKILDRAHASIVGTLRRDRDQWLVLPDGGDYARPILIEDVHLGEARPGDKVAVRIRCYPTASQPARGTITTLLGPTGGFQTETEAIIRRHQLPDAFDPSSLVEALNARAAFKPQQSVDRKDITDHLIVTVDPPDAQDFDDAISLIRSRRGNWILGVHIADVSHFVPAGSALDHGARLRGNSVYLPGRTLPMLPEMLSNDLCSLQPDQLRFAKSVYLTFTKDGEVRSTRFANTLIRSKARLTYREVTDMLKGKPHSHPRAIVTLLRRMDQLARLIETRRRQAGMLQLEMNEIELLRDDSGAVVGVKPKDSSTAHRLIEMFMIEANVAVATLLDRYCVLCMRRVHGPPKSAALRHLSGTLRLLGVTFPRQPSRCDFQRLIADTQDAKQALPIHILVLRSLEKAEYMPANIGHYALAAAKYCHFTSPIRRYADLLVHRALDAYLTQNLDQARCRHSFDELTRMGQHLSDTERRADTAELELKTICILHLLRQQIGEAFDGVVVNLSSFGVQVRLPDYGVEGLIPPEALGPDDWQFDAQNQCLVGHYSGSVIRLAQALKVVIVEVHAAASRLDLAPAYDLVGREPKKQLSQRRRKPVRQQHGRRRR